MTFDVISWGRLELKVDPHRLLAPQSHPILHINDFFHPKFFLHNHKIYTLWTFSWHLTQVGVKAALYEILFHNKKASLYFFLCKIFAQDMRSSLIPKRVFRMQDAINQKWSKYVETIVRLMVQNEISPEIQNQFIVVKVDAMQEFSW